MLIISLLALAALMATAFAPMLTRPRRIMPWLWLAGVPANKIMVGISSYGRSFKMAEASCTGPMCHYVRGRNQSPAMKGECTETGVILPMPNC